MVSNILVEDPKNAIIPIQSTLASFLFNGSGFGTSVKSVGTAASPYVQKGYLDGPKSEQSNRDLRELN
jgi:hypothetical protein